jgi:penicillin-binding protein 1A
MEPQTGLVKAWVGGIDHKYFQYDHVKSQRQVGSTFKPVVYAQALINGMQPCEYTHNRLVTYAEYDNWQPHNSNGKYGGVYSMEGALSQSVNAVTVEIILRAGIDSVRQLAQAMGIDHPIPVVPSIGLGAVDASLLEMIQVYGTFANRGRRPQIHYLDRIETNDGQVLISFERPNPNYFEKVLEEETADMMVRMLQSVVDSGTGRRLRYEFGLYNDIAGKTGTTQNQTDGWFMGFTPNLVAGAWVGAELPSVHFRTMHNGQGSSTALPLFGSFLRKIYKDEKFRKMRNAKFEPLNDTTALKMDCPPYLDEMPMMNDFLQDFLENPAFFDYLFSKGVFLGEEGHLELPTPHENESKEEYMDRIYRFIERMERKDEKREKRKEFWSNLLFGKEKEQDQKERNRKNNNRNN